MDSLNPDSKLPDESKTDSTNDYLNISELRKSEIAKKKCEKARKEEIKIFGITSDELVAIGRSTCGRWVKFQQKLGEGGYKTVFKAYDTEKGNNVAWCEFKSYHVDSKEKQANMMHEIEIMVKMDHPNIVTCYDVFDEYVDMRSASNPIPLKSIILIQELMGEGTLKSVIKKNFINGKLILKFALITYWLHQIVSALSYMHDKLNPPIIHRDLKADNCFLESKSSEKYLNVKVGDFGLAKELGNKEKNTMLGTVGFMAPEVYDEKYDAKVDIYAFGMLMLEVVTNRTPYDDCETVMQVAKETMSGKLPEIFNLVHDPGTREVISCCIHPLSSYRPSAMELYYHPIFLNRNEDEVKNMLPVEITPNFDKCIDREAMVNYFVANIVNEDLLYHTKFNLRMDFRDKRIQKSLNLDEGESLEFDLDVYKKDDIPELIANLKSEFEENMRDGLNPNKSIEAKQINTQLEKIFKSMEFQMQFLFKMIIGKRWFYILESILSKQVDLDLKDDVTGFSLLATYKTNWQTASKQLEAEMENYIKLGNSDEMKKISKIFKNGEALKTDSPVGPSIESVKIDKKSVDGSVRPKCESIDSPSIPYPMPTYMYPMPSPMPFCPMNYIPYPCVNPFFWPQYTPVVTPTRNSTEPAMSYYRYPDSQQPKKSETDMKSNRTPVTAATRHSPVEGFDQNSRDELDGMSDKIFTLEEVVQFITSKSHRYSSNPFTVIPIAGQSNAFRVVKINDSKYIDNNAPEESNDSTGKMKSNLKHRSVKGLKISGSQTTPTVPVPNTMMGYPPYMVLPPPMYGSCPVFPNMPTMGAPAMNVQQMNAPPMNSPPIHVPPKNISPINLPPMNSSPNLFQYWIQQQNYFQNLQQQHFQQQFLQPGFCQLLTHSVDSVQLSDRHMQNNQEMQWETMPEEEEERCSNCSIKEFPEDNKSPMGSDITNAKFVVRTIEETLSHVSSSDYQSECHAALPNDNKETPVDNGKVSSKKLSKPRDVQENCNKCARKLKENNCTLRIANRNFERELSSSINSRGEEVEPKSQFRKVSANQILYRSSGSQTIGTTSPISILRRSKSIGTSTYKCDEVGNRTRDDLHRSSTCDVISSQSVTSTNVNSSHFVQLQTCYSSTNNNRTVLQKAEMEKVELYKFGKLF